MDRHPDGYRESFYVLAGRTVRLRIVGCELARCIDLPLAHLRTASEPSNPQLLIELWDERDAGVSCQVGGLHGIKAATVDMNLSQDGRFVINSTHHSLTCLDRGTQHIVGCAADARQLSLYERGRPLHVPLTVWHNDSQVPIMHGGLVSQNGQGVLFAGAAGSGKSTSSLACLCAGFDFLSEDLFGLQSEADGLFLGHSLYSSTYLDPDHLSRFPALKPHALEGREVFEDKRLIVLSKVFPGRLARCSEIRAVVIPRVAKGRASRFRAASRADALLALAPSSILRSRISSGTYGFNELAKLAGQVPCFHLELGHSLTEISRSVSELLAEAGAKDQGEGA